MAVAIAADRQGSGGADPSGQRGPPSLDLDATR
jgi:hypothetical protein